MLETGNGFAIGFAFGETGIEIKQKPALIDLGPDCPGGFIGAAFEIAAVHFAEIHVGNWGEIDGCADDLGGLLGAMKRAEANLRQALCRRTSVRLSPPEYALCR